MIVLVQSVLFILVANSFCLYLGKIVLDVIICGVFLLN